MCRCTPALSGCPPPCLCPPPGLPGPLRPDTPQEGLEWELPRVGRGPASIWGLTAPSTPPPPSCDPARSSCVCGPPIKYLPSCGPVSWQVGFGGFGNPIRALPGGPEGRIQLTFLRPLCRMGLRGLLVAASLERREGGQARLPAWRSQSRQSPPPGGSTGQWLPRPGHAQSLSGTGSRAASSTHALVPCPERPTLPSGFSELRVTGGTQASGCRFRVNISARVGGWGSGLEPGGSACGPWARSASEGP